MCHLLYPRFVLVANQQIGAVLQIFSGPTRAKLNIFDFNEMNIDNTSLTSLNREFKEYENINIDFDIDVLDFLRQLKHR